MTLILMKFHRYVTSIGDIIAKAQITNGGPGRCFPNTPFHVTNPFLVILYQPENEYSYSAAGADFLSGSYMQIVIDQIRNASVVVPLINNDGSSYGFNAPGTGEGEVDIYGYDNYPYLVYSR